MPNRQGAQHYCSIPAFEMEISSLLLVVIHDCAPGQRLRDHLWTTSRQPEYLWLYVQVCPRNLIVPAPQYHLRSLGWPHGLAPRLPYITSQSHESLQMDLSHLRCTYPLSRKACKLTNMPSTLGTAIISESR